MLAIGDFHVPFRSPELAARFRTLLVAGKIQHILCTGNLVSFDVDDYLRSLSPDVHIVRGDMDMVCSNLQQNQVAFEISCVAVIDSLAVVARYCFCFRKSTLHA